MRASARPKLAGFLVLLACLWLSQTEARAQASRCDLALVLAMDASSSVDPVEYDLQLKGVAAALLDPEVTQAILSIGGLHLAAFEWNGRSNQEMIIDWVWLETEQQIFETARSLTRHVRNADNFPTAVGHALAFASLLHRDAPLQCFRKVIDVSGDGANNEGYGPEIAYKSFDFDGIIVNGLVIRESYPSPESFYRDAVIFYKREVLKGPGSFLIIAEGFNDFERAMKKKLLKEIVPGPVSDGGIPVGIE